jgi:hypothetical protein
MAVYIQRKGKYELFETSSGNRILALGLNDWYAWVTGQQGEILVRSDADHDRARTVQAGEYYLVDFEDDPKFSDVPHLFLQQNGAFREVIVPNGLPTDDETPKRVVGTSKSVSVAELKRYLHEDYRDPASGMAPERELPIPDFDELSVRAARARLEGLSEEELRILRDHEAIHKQRKTLIHAIDRRLP